jgi:hypothetical protein
MVPFSSASQFLMVWQVTIWVAMSTFASTVIVVSSFLVITHRFVVRRRLCRLWWLEGKGRTRRCKTFLRISQGLQNKNC